MDTSPIYAQNSLTKAATSTPDVIAAQLRTAILRGRYRNDEPLRQDSIAAEFGVSKVPIREALVQLKSEGLVTFKTNRGAFIATLSPQEAEEIYTMRIALESLAIRRAIPKLSKVDLAKANGILDVIDAEDDPMHWGHHNWAFHACLYQAADMPLMLDTIERLHVNVGRYLVLYLADMDYQDASQEEHRAILDACRQGNATTAIECLTNHLQNASTQLIEHLSNSH